MRKFIQSMLTNVLGQDSYRREGRSEMYEWCYENGYFYLFERWDDSGNRK